MEFNLKTNKEVKHDACYLSRVETDNIKLVGYSSDDLAKPTDFPMTYKERVIYNGNMNSNRFGKPIKSKKQKREEKRNGLFSKSESLELDEWFVYLVDGENWYYKFVQDLSILKMHHSVKFLGIGRPNKGPNNVLQIKEKTTNDNYINRNEKADKSNKKKFYYLLNGIQYAFNKQKNVDVDFAGFNEVVFLGNELAKEYPLRDCIGNSLKYKKNILDGEFNCCYCEISLTKKNFTREHLLPRDRGGKNYKENIRPCCSKCNNEKGNLMLHTYIQMLNLQMLDVTGQDLIKLQTKIANANRLAKELENSIDKK